MEESIIPNFPHPCSPSEEAQEFQLFSSPWKCIPLAFILWNSALSMGVRVLWLPAELRYDQRNGLQAPAMGFSIFKPVGNKNFHCL
ncbi:hypothetical protein CEXT_686921 [Caerostris extrusa]|uniref:Uncharacterized protein n=1 Tax=Caerostris extrusa TaxID=172846 RepID=A0AAV4T6U2_CAEEX|nr:hypothetical protein CEXT_686921 [Caerostris extrusa]